MFGRGLVFVLIVMGLFSAEQEMTIRNNGSLWASIESGGPIRIGGSLVGRWEDDGTIRKGGSIWGSVSEGCPDHESLKKAAAVLVFFAPDYFGNY